MNRDRASRVLLTTVLVGGAVMSFILDWQRNHLLNPLWHPHARFHGAILLFLFAGVAATGTWLLWRDSREPRVAITVASLLSASYWAPFFFVPYLLPGSSWWAGIPGHEPHVAGFIVYPNLIVVGICLALTILAWKLGSGATEEQARLS